MKTAQIVSLVSSALLASPAFGAAVYLTTTDGKVWQYDSVADMGSQTSSTNAGVEVASHAAYGSDLGSTMDLSNGKVYRITGAGDVVEYSNLSGYLGNTGAATIATAEVRNSSPKIVIRVSPVLTDERYRSAGRGG